MKGIMPPEKFAARNIRNFRKQLATPNDRGCTEFTGFRNKHGYGRVRYMRRKELAHRVAWMIEVGRIPDGIDVCHKCDNPPCCNVEHLFLGTAKQNIRDAMQKGRFRTHTHRRNPPRGEKSRSAKLTAQLVREIRRRRAAGETTVSIGADLSVHSSVVSRAARGKTWSHIRGE